MEDTTNLALPYIMPSQAQKHVTHNEALRLLDGIVQLGVLDRDLAAPPASPAEGDRYIVAAAASGDWSGREDDVAAFQDGAWAFMPPRHGWLAFAADESRLLYYTGSGWASVESAIGVLQNLALMGVGTTADTTNPFAAKLNTALWTARYAGEGGDGDLRYTLNKETSAGTLSLLMQDNWSGRAEIGLTGDDNLHVKVSADGTSWTEALVVDGSSGAVQAAAPLSVTTDTGYALSIDLEEGNGVFRATRYAAGASAPVFMGRKARGTRALPTAAQAADTLIGFRGYGHDGTGFVSGSAGVAFLLEAAENWVHGSNNGTQIRFFTTQNGTLSNIERLKIGNDGSLQVRAGAQTLVDANGIVGLRAYTVTTLPSAATAGQLIYVSDGTSNKRLAVADGTNWRWPDGGVVS